MLLICLIFYHFQVDTLQTFNAISNIGNNAACTSVSPTSPADCSSTTQATYPVGTITAADIDFASVANPAVISNIIYGTVGYDFDVCSYPIFAAVGGSYEFPDINTALTRWKVWGKVGVSF